MGFDKYLTYSFVSLCKYESTEVKWSSDYLEQPQFGKNLVIES